MAPKKTPMSDAAIKVLIAQGIADALVDYESNQSSRNGNDSHNSRSVEKYVGGLPDMIQGSVMASKPKTMQEAIEIANDLMDQKVRTFADHQAENKRKLDDNTRNNQTQQPPSKRQNMARAYSTVPSEKNESLAATNNQRTLTCYECGNQGHYRSDCPKIKNRNHGKQTGGTEARRMVYALGGGKIGQDPNNMEDNIDAQREDFLA
ncbi:reverse transcriptase domain-containing protein [Tanacetum coccineum]